MNAGRLRQDNGAILVIALIVVTTVALVVGTVLTRGDGSLRATVALREVAGSTYAADGAGQIAINGLRTGHWTGTDTKPAGWAFSNVVGDGCFGRDNNASILTPKDGLLLSNFYPASASGDAPTSAYVECVAEVATGAQGTARIVTSANRPGNAILTLGAGGENGLHSKTNGNVLKVRGSIWSNSNIVAERPIEVEAADVRARTGCSGTITVSPGFSTNCGSGSMAPDPNLPSDLTGLPPLRTVPACSGSVLTFEPGYYDDADALEAITTTCNRVFWFKPGTYYFDFHNRSGDPLYESGVTGSSSDNEWSITTGKLVAGTPTNAAGAIIAVPPANPTIPGACQSPISSTTSQGVQFVFGGESRMRIAGNTPSTAPQVELCGTYRANRPPIVVYGQKAGTTSALTVLGGATALTPTGTPVVAAAGTFVESPGSGVLTAAALQQDDGAKAVWQRDGTGPNSNQTASITMSDFATGVPQGSVLKAARLVVRHKSAQNNAGTASTIRIAPTASTALAAFDLGRPGTLTTQTLDLKATLTAAQWGVLAKGVHDSGFTGANITYTASVGRNQSAELDAVRLELEYYVPQVRGETAAAVPGNCLAVIGSGCSVLYSEHNFKGQLYLQGTTYVPLARLDIGLGNMTAQVFRWGVIARSIYIESTGAFAFPGAVIELPDASPGLGLDGTLVQLKVYLCPGSSTCSSSGTLALTARVQVWDPTGTSVAGARQVSVLSWSHQR